MTELFVANMRLGFREAVEDRENAVRGTANMRLEFKATVEDR